MVEPSQKPALTSPEEEPLAGAKKIVDIFQKIGGVGGALAAVVSKALENKWAFGGGLCLCILSAGWYFISRWQRRRRRQKAPPVHLESTNKAFLRGLLPFEKGEALLGRDGDLRQILVKITSSEFRFGYISGEAGSGKTSLLRAGLLSEAEKAGLWIVYTPKPSVNPVAAITKALQAEFADPPLEAGSSLRELVAEVGRRLQGRRLLLVCDQFEEFFVANRTLASRRPFIR